MNESILIDKIGILSEKYECGQVKKVNGVEIENLKHLAEMVENCRRERLRFDLDDERVIVLNYESAKIATCRILKRHRIPSSISRDLIVEKHNSSSSSEAESESAAAAAAELACLG